MNLRIGQRVKKVRGTNNLGVTGVVVGIGSLVRKGGAYVDPAGQTFTGTYDCDFKVKVDSATAGHFGVKPAGTVMSASSAHWEPIIPDGAAPSEFSTLADLLNGLKVTA